MSEKLTPKQELILTLEEMARVVGVGAHAMAPSPELRLIQMRGLIDHAQALAQRVGQEARAPKKGGVPA